MKTVHISQTIITEAMSLSAAIDANRDGAYLAQVGATQDESEALEVVLMDMVSNTIVCPVDGGLAFFDTTADHDTWAAQA